MNLKRVNDDTLNLPSEKTEELKRFTVWQDVKTGKYCYLKNGELVEF